MWQQLLLEWYERNQRILPWRQTKDPYRIWISEIMLQQTRVETVKEYYRQFLLRFPDIASLAAAEEDEVLKYWEGLGYYSRARNLHKAAKKIVVDYNGLFPHDYDQIIQLPGIGAYTGGAVASIAFQQCIPAIDGNVYRVASRFFGIHESIERPTVQKMIRSLIQDSIPQNEPGSFNQSLMELGAMICTPPAVNCELCPIKNECEAFKEGDAETLPFHEKKAPPKEIEVAVLLITWNDQILIVQRKEKLLNGMYVFYLIENLGSKEEAKQVLEQEELPFFSICYLQDARHVFTHRIWNMHLFHVELSDNPAQWLKLHQEAKLVSWEELQLFPVPNAMRDAKKAAQSILKNHHASAFLTTESEISLPQC